MDEHERAWRAFVAARFLVTDPENVSQAMMGELAPLHLPWLCGWAAGRQAPAEAREGPPAPEPALLEAVRVAKRPDELLRAIIAAAHPALREAIEGQQEAHMQAWDRYLGLRRETRMARADVTIPADLAKRRVEDMVADQFALATAWGFEPPHKEH